MKSKMQEKGQALIIIALAAIGLFAFTALAIDGTRGFSDKRHAQNAADTAVLAAALAKIRAPGDDAAKTAAAVTAAEARAYSNGYFDDPDTVVDVYLCSDPQATCEDLPTGANLSEYIQVRIVSTIPTTFARIFGRQTLTSAVQAVARVQGGGSSGSSWGNAAMVSTKAGDLDDCFWDTGTADVITHNSGIYVNCSGDAALSMNGNAKLLMDANAEVVGCYSYNGHPTITPGLECSINGGVSQNFDSQFDSVPTTLTPPSCGSTPGSPPGSTTYHGGNYTNLNITGNAVLSPGVYCVTGSVNISGTVTSTGKVQIVMPNGNLSFGSDQSFSDLEIYTVDGDITLNSNGDILSADRLRVFSTGNTDFRVNGKGIVDSDNAYFYLANGDINWNGQADIDLHAPPAGDQFGGLLIYKPLTNTTSTTINGGADVDLTGTFLSPGAHVTINGNADFVLHSQFIASTFKIAGNGEVEIYYDPDENYPWPDDTTIELSQ